MTPIIPLACLVVVLAGYRLASWECRFLYSIWEHKRIWGDFYAAVEKDRAWRRAIIQMQHHSAIIPRIIAAATPKKRHYEITFTIEAKIPDAFKDLGKAASATSVEMAKFGDTMGNINFTGWQFASGTGEVRE